MADKQEEFSSAYLFANSPGESFLSNALALADQRNSGVHFVFPLVGAWGSLTVLDTPPDDLRAIRRLVADLLSAAGGVLHYTVAIPWPPGRIKKLELPLPLEVIVAMRTQAGASQALFNDLQTELRPGEDVGVLVEPVNGSYDLVCELSGNDLESMQGALEQLRSAVGERATVDISYASF